jgi:hypothetical protein
VTAWVILFRGVGGAVQLPVKRLKDSLVAGFDHVATYINSGNAVVTSALPREEVIRGVGDACARDLGLTKAVHVQTRDEWAELIARNPFPEAVAAPTTLHAAVPEARPDPTRVPRCGRSRQAKAASRSAARWPPCTPRTASAAPSSENGSTGASALPTPRATGTR